MLAYSGYIGLNKMSIKMTSIWFFFFFSQMWVLRNFNYICGLHPISIGLHCLDCLSAIVNLLVVPLICGGPSYRENYIHTLPFLKVLPSWSY